MYSYLCIFVYVVLPHTDFTDLATVVMECQIPGYCLSIIVFECNAMQCNEM